MTDEAKTEPKAEESGKKIVDEFQALPLSEKLRELLKMEAVALGETLTFVVNSPYLVIEKIGDVLAEFGMKMDRQSKRPRAEKKRRDARIGPAGFRCTGQSRPDKDPRPARILAKARVPNW